MVNNNISQRVILLVEDDPGDQVLTRRALDDAPFPCDLRVVDNGSDALDYLHRRGKFMNEIDSPRPDLILLDLNLPRMNGRAVLDHIKTLREFKRIPVVILTTSDRESDVVASYDGGCNSFVTKPVAIDRFMPLVQGLGRYWFELVTTPR